MSTSLKLGLLLLRMTEQTWFQMAATASSTAENTNVPEFCSSPAGGGECLWASPASPRSAACPGSPGTSPLPPRTPYIPEFGACWPRPGLGLVRDPSSPSPWPSTEGPAEVQPTRRAAGGGRRWWGAWRQRRSALDGFSRLMWRDTGGQSELSVGEKQTKSWNDILCLTWNDFISLKLCRSYTETTAILNILWNALMCLYLKAVVGLF